MAIVLHSNVTRQYRSIRESRVELPRDIVIKASYIFLHQLDLILSVFAVSVGLHELNPIIRSLLASPLQLVVVKLAIPLLIVWFVPGKLLIPAIVLLSLVICWNVKELVLVLF